MRGNRVRRKRARDVAGVTMDEIRRVARLEP